MLGVAVPGIAPLNPGVEKSARAPAHAPAPAARPPAPSAAAHPEEPIDIPGVRRGASGKGRGKLLAWIAVIAALLLAVIGIGVVLLSARGPAIATRVGLDANNRERLELSCTECPDGTSVSIGDDKTVFHGSQAQLPLRKPPAIGTHEMDLQLTLPGEDQKRVRVPVTVNYRVTTDLAGLDDTKPSVAIKVTVGPDSSATIDGESISLDSQGSGALTIDLSEELTGAATSVKTLERVVPYTVTAKGQPPRTGQVRVRLAITTLALQAPLERVVTDKSTFRLDGRTDPGAEVRVNKGKIVVDAKGAFKQLMGVSKRGATTVVVRARHPDRAPRLIPIQVKRVASLKAEAVDFAKKASTSYAAIASDTTKKIGWPVALSGKIVEARTTRSRTHALLDVKTGCAKTPCLVRLVYGAPLARKAGDPLWAYGRVRAAVSGPRRGTKIPEITTDFVLTEAP